MATNTYVAIRTTVVPTATPSVTLDLTGITGYTDLRIVYNGTISATGMDIRWRFNGDTGSNYSFTYLNGNGSTASSGRQSNTSYIASYATTGTSGAPGTILFDVMNYSNTTTYKTTLSRVSDAPVEVNAYVGLWRSTSAITSVTIFPNANNITAGSTFTVYGIAAETASVAKATGGTITLAADGYVYHAFTSSGTFTPSVGLTCDVLTVAGGGGAGANHGGGGGAGGLLYTSSSSFSATGYTVTVGQGGVGATIGGTIGTNGENSSVNGLTAIGGGRGGDYSNNYEAYNGGSGGGAQSSATNYAGLGTSGQGNNGGNKNPNYNLCGGGGGGAGAVGQTATNANSGAGGVGLATYSHFGAATNTGHNVSGIRYYAGGGGGGGWNGSIPVGTYALGGHGGGGASGAVISSGASNGSAGTANTGGGGGCGGGGSSSGGNGGSGIVIIRYPK